MVTKKEVPSAFESHHHNTKIPAMQYLLDIAWRGFYGLCITDCGTEAAIV